MSFSPTLMRWMQLDPIGYDDGMNRNLLEQGNPISHLDPSGTQTAPAPTLTPERMQELFNDLNDERRLQDAVNELIKNGNEDVVDAAAKMAADKKNGEAARNACDYIVDSLANIIQKIEIRRVPTIDDLNHPREGVMVVTFKPNWTKITNNLKVRPKLEVTGDAVIQPGIDKNFDLATKIPANGVIEIPLFPRKIGASKIFIAVMGVKKDNTARVMDTWSGEIEVVKAQK